MRPRRQVGERLRDERGGLRAGEPDLDECDLGHRGRSGAPLGEQLGPEGISTSA